MRQQCQLEAGEQNRQPRNQDVRNWCKAEIPLIKSNARPKTGSRMTGLSSSASREAELGAPGSRSAPSRRSRISSASLSRREERLVPPFELVPENPKPATWAAGFDTSLKGSAK